MRRRFPENSFPKQSKTYLESIVPGVEKQPATRPKPVPAALFFVRAENEKASDKNNNSSVGFENSNRQPPSLFVR